jgi:diguanylate cyclase (GGDEF)-like protein/PAS domain S-box-containing protein
MISSIKEKTSLPVFLPSWGCSFFCAIAVCLWLVSGKTALGVGTPDDRVLEVSEERGVDFLAPWMDMVADTHGTMGVQEIKAEFAQGQSRQMAGRALNFGISSSAYWLRFRIQPPADALETVSQRRIFDPGIAFPGRLQWTLYGGSSEGLLASGGSGTTREHITQIPMSDGPGIYYLRIQSTTGLLLCPRLFSCDTYFDHVRMNMFWYGGFYGILLAVAAYSIFLFISFNDRSYLWYVLHLVFAILYFLCVNGLAERYLLPGYSELLGMFSRSFLGLLATFIILFTRAFFSDRIRSKNVQRAIMGLFVASLAVTLSNLVVPARIINSFLVGMGLIVPFAMTLIALDALKGGFKPARFFMLAYGLVFLGTLSFALTSGGIMPFSAASFNGFQIGIAVSAVLLSIALADRIRTLRQERTMLKRGMQRVTAIMDSVECGIFLIEKKTNIITEINQSAAEILDGKRGEIVGQPCWKFIPSAGGTERKGCQLPLDNAHYEGRLTGMAGEEIPVLGRARAIELEGLDLILASFADITSLKRAEEALRRSEDKYRTLFESSRDAVMLLEDMRFVDCNTATLKMLGCGDETQLVGRGFADFAPPMQAGDVDSEKDAARQLQTAMDKGSHFFEWIFRRRDGVQFPAEVMLSAAETGEKILVQAMIRDITKRKNMETELVQLALTDSLTGANNRRSFLQKAAQELLRSQRYDHPFSFLMMDVDRFKSINDAYGHAMGDKVLKALVSRSLQILRATDVFGRLGGEEFGVVLPETDTETAMKTTERLRKEISGIAVESNQGAIRFTVSIGLAVLKGKDESLEKVMNRADKALLLAKKNGRNLIVTG